VHNNCFFMFGKFSVKFGLALLLLSLAFVGWWYFSDGGDELKDLAITEAKQSNVKQVLSETGVVEANRDASLSFGVRGQIESINATSGTAVDAGELIAQLDTDGAQADLKGAQANLEQQQARLAELRARSPADRQEANQANIRAASASLAVAEDNLQRVREQQNELVRSARENLYTTKLRAYLAEGSDVSGDNFTPPTITGTYNGTTSGSFRLSMFKSGSDSGWSYRSNGLGDGEVGSVSTVQPQPIGRGLYIEFPDNFAASRKIEWRIPVPNNRAEGYAGLKSAVEKTKEQRKSALETARGKVVNAQAALDQAKSQAKLTDAQSTENKITAQVAAVEAAEAQVAKAQSSLDDHRITAPFSGVVTDIFPSEGERVAGNESVARLVSTGSYEVVVDIPEVDTDRLDTSDSATVSFDALPQQTQTAQVDEIARTANTVEGVRTIEVTLFLPDTNIGIRPGLSADVDITTATRNGVVTVPDRAVFTDSAGEFVYIPAEDNTVKRQRVETGLEGSAGRVEIVSGLSAGDQIVSYVTQEQKDLIESNVITD
jgi:RND family efflux transporter MFP subunit